MNKAGQNTMEVSQTPPLSKTTEKAVSNNEIIVDGCQESITLHKGQRLVIKLPATQATGFSWQTKEPPTILKPTNADVLEYEKQPDDGAVGKAGKQLIRFTAEKEGSEVLTLNYFRPFDKNNIVESCTMKIIVQ